MQMYTLAAVLAWKIHHCWSPPNVVVIISSYSNQMNRSRLQDCPTSPLRDSGLFQFRIPSQSARLHSRIRAYGRGWLSPESNECKRGCLRNGWEVKAWRRVERNIDTCRCFDLVDEHCCLRIPDFTMLAQRQDDGQWGQPHGEDVTWMIQQISVHCERSMLLIPPGLTGQRRPIHPLLWDVDQSANRVWFVRVRASSCNFPNTHSTMAHEARQNGNRSHLYPEHPNLTHLAVEASPGTWAILHRLVTVSRTLRFRIPWSWARTSEFLRQCRVQDRTSHDPIPPPHEENDVWWNNQSIQQCRSDNPASTLWNEGRFHICAQRYWDSDNRRRTSMQPRKNLVIHSLIHCARDRRWQSIGLQECGEPLHHWDRLLSLRKHYFTFRNRRRSRRFVQRLSMTARPVHYSFEYLNELWIHS
jgi:hypothetical protein